VERSGGGPVRQGGSAIAGAMLALLVIGLDQL
jgi:hypothetical protein